MILLKYFLLGIKQQSLIHSINLRRYSDKIKYGNILER